MSERVRWGAVAVVVLPVIGSCGGAEAPPNAPSPAPTEEAPAAAASATPPPAPPAPEAESIFFATDRMQENGTFGPKRSASPDPQSYGVCTVGVPADAESPHHSWWNVFHWNGPDHAAFHLVETKVLGGAMLDHLHAQIESAPADAREALVFVHGYNTTFAEGCERAAEIAFTLRHKGPVFLYSWPAYGGDTGFARYTRDLNNAKGLSAIHFASFLDAVVKRVQPSALHVVAHSMGSQVTFEAFEKGMAITHASVHASEVVLAAPDVDANEFVAAKGALAPFIDRLTIYVSAGDKALDASKNPFVNGYPRLGQYPITVGDGFDTIDASHVSTSPNGHSYIVEKTTLRDLGAVLAHDMATADPRRAWLAERQTSSHPYFELRGP